MSILRSLPGALAVCCAAAIVARGAEPPPAETKSLPAEVARSGQELKEFRSRIEQLQKELQQAEQRQKDLLARLQAAPAPGTNTAGLALFTNHVRAALAQNCLECHGGRHTKSGLDLSTREGLLQGGEHGAAIVAGDAAASWLFKRIAHTEEPGMPFKRDKLPAETLANIAAWIKAGAPYGEPLKWSDPDRKSNRDVKDFWAVQPLARVPVPDIKTNWGRTPVDAFILAKLHEKKLPPSPEADRRTLLRRITFDLHGLPPTPEEIEAFLNDTDVRAYEKVVDRLLASPRYGERWGRHWLDVAHYGDTHGYDKDKRRPTAWPYRDYVIQALNEDKPYGRFAQEQIAGDALFPEEPDALVATGFIAAGPWDYVGHVELREDTTDKKITRVLDRDDMVANTISTFNSLTVHCARCHDHKFDPITMEDYYRLQAVFAGIDRASRPYHTNREIHNLRRSLEPEQRAVEAELKDLNGVIGKITSPKIKGLDAWLEYLRGTLAETAAPASALKSPSKGYHSQVARTRYETKWVQVDLGHAWPIEQIFLVPAHLKFESHAGPGFGFPKRFKVEVADNPGFTNATVVADETRADFPNPEDAPYAVVVGQASSLPPGLPAPGTVAVRMPAKTGWKPAPPAGRYVRVTATRLWKRGEKKFEDWIFALGELVVVSGGRNVAAGGAVTAQDSTESAPTWARKYLVDGNSSLIVLANASPTDGYQSAIVTKPDTNTVKWVQADLGRALKIDQVRLVPARSAESPEKLGHGFPVRFRVEASDDPEFKVSEMLADQTKGDFANPGDKPFTTVGATNTARYVRVTATRLWSSKEEHLFALAEMQIASGSVNAARTATFTALDSTERGRWSVRHLADGYSSLAALAEPSAGDGYQSTVSPLADANKWVQVDLGKPVRLDRIALVPARSEDAPGSFGHGFPVRFRVEVSNDADFKKSKTLVNHTTNDFPNPGDAPVFIAGRRERARYVRVTVTKLWKQKDDAHLFALAELQVITRGTNVARGATVTSSGSTEKDRWGAKYLVDGDDGQRRFDDVAGVLAQFRDLREQSTNMREQLAQRRALVAPWMDAATKIKLAKTVKRLEEMDPWLAALPKPETVFAVANNFVKDGNFSAAEDPRAVHVLKRGDVNRPGDEMKPGALACVPGLEAEFKLADPKNEAGRRAALARWIADPKNPLTWRSIVNRVWHYHFGRGLVETPNDFGRMGAAPSHPELLDWLAAEFLENGQSLKWLHRLIVTSSVYRQASGQSVVSESVISKSVKPARTDLLITDSLITSPLALDADNRYLWRMNRARLDAEAVRDAVLAASGKLDARMGGPGFDLFAFEEDHSPRYLYDKHNADAPSSLRRSVYRFVVRSAPDPWMETLDCADPSQNVPARNTTITALQALALLNNPFMVRQAEHFAERVKKLAGEPPQQIEAAYRLALGRAPTGEERARLVDYCAKHGLANTCRLIFNSNEFLFVD